MFTLDQIFERCDDPSAIVDADIPQLREQVRAFALEARDAGDVDKMSRCADVYEGLQYIANVRACQRPGPRRRDRSCFLAARPR
jgi:hypothetical protein